MKEEEKKAPAKKGAVKYGTLVKMVNELKGSMNEMLDMFGQLSDRVDALETVEVRPAAELPKEGGPTVQTQEESGIINVVKNVLGQSFTVETEVAEPGISFRLKITPPDHLKEHKDDVRVKNITNIEGEAGSRAYAEQVKAYCINWASSRGVAYEQ